MKIRIMDNSIRLRLTKTDVEDLKNKNVVENKTIISEKEIFTYSLRSEASQKEISATFHEGKMNVIIPSETARILTETNEITVKGWQKNGEKEDLFLLIEKDLQCIDETEEDQSDMYDNPKTAC